MKTHGILGTSGSFLVIATIVAFHGAASRSGAVGGGQDQAKSPPAAQAAGSVEAIDREFQRELIPLEKKRLERLAELAARQPKAEAEKTYEVYLSSAASRELFQEAEPVAEKILKAGDASHRLRFLAHAVTILAKVRRGDYEGSLASAETACQSARPLRQDAGKSPPLPLAERLALIELYYQGLIQSDQFDIARKALTMIRDKSQEASEKEYLDERLGRLAMRGKPAPSIEGTDIDGQPFRLADQKGNVVLVVFWASWNMPNVHLVGKLKELERVYRDRGLRIVGIDLDALQTDARGADAVLPQVRRFLLEQNVTWPNLMEGRGGSGYAKAYGVSEIPANFLIGRDGKIIHFDLAGANFGRVIADAIKQ